MTRYEVAVYELEPDANTRTGRERRRRWIGGFIVTGASDLELEAIARGVAAHVAAPAFLVEPAQDER